MEAHNNLFKFAFAGLKNSFSMTRKCLATNLSLSFTLLVFISQCFSQGIAIGQWRDHLPYSQGRSVAAAGKKIFYASRSGMFSYDTQTQELERLSKINGLSDIGISRIQYDTKNQCLVIAYEDANIDLIKSEGIINVNDIARKNIPGDKSIYDITIHEGFAYLSCGFGVVLLDLKKNEIKDTYIIGPNGNGLAINATSIGNNTIFACTGSGIYKASLGGANLSDYNNWTLVEGLPLTAFASCAWFDNTLYAGKNYNLNNVTDTLFVLKNGNLEKRTFPFFTFKGLEPLEDKLIVTSSGGFFIIKADTVSENFYTYGDQYFMYPSEVCYTSDGNYWIADELNGLMRSASNYNFSFISMNGPSSAFSYAMDSYQGNLLVAGGLVNASWENQYKIEGVFAFTDETWSQFPGGVHVLGTDTYDIRDVLDVQIDRNDPSHFFAASYLTGLAEYKDKELVKVYNDENSSLQNIYVTSVKAVRASGLGQDADGNLWVSNSQCSQPLSVRKPDGTWKSFFLGANLQNQYVGELVVDDWGTKWIILPRGGGIAVFNENATLDNTTDDDYKKLTASIGQGGLPSTQVNTIAKDKEGEIWVGCDQGIFVFYSPGDVFGNSPTDAQQILVTQDSIANYLLESENVTSIAVDGANRKWIGTQKAGVFLMSADGTQEILHFNEENSPLFSNEIVSICINDLTGEVFFITGKGIISYRGEATEGVDEIDKKQVYAYPNPVRPGYEGKIAIKGLTANADIKITDASGELVYATTALGGQAIWDGITTEGKRAHTGIYLVFSTDETGKQTVVTKIMLMN
jgi:hypothetical protein